MADFEGARIKASARALLFGGAAEALRIGRLEILERVGAGGMGEVYVARDVELDRKVAVKLVRSDVDGSDGEASARIVREAQLMARFTHPNVVRVYDVGRIDGRVYIVMEFVEGVTLGAWLDRAPRPWRQIVDRFLLAGRGLAAAHKAGLVHRDFKPANVLVGDDDRVLVADFGLARNLLGEPGVLDTEVSATALPRAGATTSSPMGVVTVQGALLGTVGYMSPEQLCGATVDARSDVFSFCVALYEALAGVRPFAGDGVSEILCAIEGGVITPPAGGRRLSRRIGRALARGLAADPGQRFATMDALLAVLEGATRRRGRVLAGALGLCAAFAGALVLPPVAADPCASARAELDDAWGDGRREALRSAFDATGLSYAGATWIRVRGLLDAYADAWTAARVDACEADAQRSHSPRLYDLRMICLERRKRAFSTLVDRFAGIEPEGIAGSIEAAATLPATSLCGDVEALDRGVRPPEQRGVEIVVAQAREMMARGEALRATGRYVDGLALADAALELVGRIDYPPARAEALALRGRLLVHMGVLEEGEGALLDAVELAEASHHDELAADVWLALVRHANRGRSDPARGREWIRRARAAQRRLGDAPARRLDVLAEEGLVEALARDLPAAERSLRAALALHEEIGGDGLTRGKIEQDLAGTLEAGGRVDEAGDAYARALALIEDALGPEHPEFAHVVHDYGAFLLLHGDLSEAQARLEDALRIATAAHGPAHQVVGRIHIALVEAALRRGDSDEAVAHAEVATQSYAASLPAEHPDHADAALALGSARYFAGDLGGALVAFVEARERLRRDPRSDPLAAAIAACDVAETEVALGRLDAAEVSFAEVSRLLADAGIVDHDLDARVLAGRGEIALARGERDVARRRLEEALALRRRLPADPLALAQLEEALARAGPSSPSSTGP
ncbi:MAG: serine/threonine protein kinase [Myxococcales bacterium]|nr:serine/threonine protein kinase [Myxococcales bacterium]